MRVLVTGSSGFLGSRLVRRLNLRGDEVRGVDRCGPGPGSTAPRLGLFRGDVCDPRLEAALRRELARADAVVHLAATPPSRERPGRGPAATVAGWTQSPGGVRTRQVGQQRCGSLGSTARVVAATPAQTPLVVVSGAGVYGDPRDGDARERDPREGDAYDSDPRDGDRDGVRSARPSRESDPLHPAGRRATWLARLEQLCRVREAWGRVTILRPFTVVGEGQRPDMAVARWLRAAAHGEPIEVVGSTGRARDVVDVEAVVDGLVACLDRAATGRAPGVVNLGSGRPRTLGEIAAAVVRVVDDRLGHRGPRSLVVHPARPDEARTTWACTRLAERTLGVDLTTDLDTVVGRQLDHALAHGLLEPPGGSAPLVGRTARLPTARHRLAVPA